MLPGVRPIDQLLDRRVSGPFPQTIDAAMDNLRSRRNACQLICHRHAEIIMAVDFQRQIAGQLLHPAHHILDGLRHCAAHGIYQADGIRRTVLHHTLQQAFQIRLPRPRRIVREIDNAQPLLMCIIHAVDAFLQYVLPRPVELGLKLRISNRNLHHNPFAPCLPCHVDVLSHGAGKCINFRFREMGADRSL